MIEKGQNDNRGGANDSGGTEWQGDRMGGEVEPVGRHLMPPRGIHRAAKEERPWIPA